MCGGAWSLFKSDVFDNLGAAHVGISSAKYGCCPIGKYMSSPEETPFLIANSCSDCPNDSVTKFENDDPIASCICPLSCPAGTYMKVKNDDRSCELCEINLCSAADTCSTSCSLTCYPLTDSTIRSAVNDWIADGDKRSKIVQQHGNIENWNTAQVTSMNGLFMHKDTFNANISRWDTSRVTDMKSSM